jgi:hypothetical protein
MDSGLVLRTRRNDEANIFHLLSAVHFAAMAPPRIRS